MDIITVEHLLETALKEILEPMYCTYEKHPSFDDGMTFDDYVFNNQQELGSRLYNLIGDHYNDCDDAIEALNE